MVGEARFVLLSEASHSTHEFYRERALITERLIDQRGFDAVVGVDVERRGICFDKRPVLC